MIVPIKKDTSTDVIVKETENQLVFTQDSLEQHYIALQTMNVSAVFVKEIQNALKDVHADEFRKQNLAVTGSINQFGEIQPIGGVNEKIEGFYKTCKALDDIKDKGVIIPNANANDINYQS